MKLDSKTLIFSVMGHRFFAKGTLRNNLCEYPNYSADRTPSICLDCFTQTLHPNPLQYWTSVTTDTLCEAALSAGTPMVPLHFGNPYAQ